jgi:hypothetical protein
MTKKVSEIEGRKNGGQFKYIFEKYCDEEGYEIMKLERVALDKKQKH